MTKVPAKDSLGDRMKFYERQYAGQKLLPLIPVCARMDGKAFHTFTKGLRRPYDERLSNLMIETTRFLVAETGAKVGYCQSDEISLVWYAENLDTMLFFDSKVLKMTSILAAMTTAFFNRRLPEFLPEKADAFPLFDTRVWNVPTLTEAGLYLLWREQDATRNSISMAAQAYYSHKELHGVSSSGKHDLLMDKGVNWNDYPDYFKRGTYVQRRTVERPFSVDELEKLPAQHEARRNPALTVKRQEVAVVSMPPLSRVANRVDALFGGERPTLRVEPVSVN
jgi:tRNA(His) guanylyltransferase